jgi:hypothetical protein
VRTWRSASLLLCACWDAIPELRPLYTEFIDRLEDAIRRLSRYAAQTQTLDRMIHKLGAQMERWYLTLS